MTLFDRKVLPKPLKLFNGLCKPVAAATTFLKVLVKLKVLLEPITAATTFLKVLLGLKVLLEPLNAKFP